jgi:hypothetical protein
VSDPMSAPWEQFPAPNFVEDRESPKDIRDADGWAQRMKPTGAPPILRLKGTATAGDLRAVVDSEQGEPNG